MAEAPEKRSPIWRWCGWLVALGLVGYLAWVLRQRAAELTAYEFRLNPWWLLPALLFSVVNVVGQALVWRFTFRRLGGAGLGRGLALRLFIYSWITRYLPGKVWMSAGKVVLGSRHGLDRQRLAVSAFLELALSSLSLLLLSVGFAPLLATDWRWTAVGLVALAGGLLLLHPRVLRGLLQRALAWRGIEADVQWLPLRDLLGIMALYLIPNLSVAAAFACLTASLVPLDVSLAGRVMVYLVWSNLLTRVSVFAPAGLGVKEGFLVLMLQRHLPVAAATLTVLLARLWFVAVDLLLLALAALAGWRARRTALARDAACSSSADSPPKP